MTLKPSKDYLAQTSVFWMESLLERRHYIRSDVLQDAEKHGETSVFSTRNSMTDETSAYDRLRAWCDGFDPASRSAAPRA